MSLNSYLERDFEQHSYFLWDKGAVNKPGYDCPTFVKTRLSIVRILVAPRTVNKIERTRRTTFSDQLASLGADLTYYICYKNIVCIHFYP